MAKSMTPPVETGMTDGQIDKAVDLFRAQLRKQRAELPSDAVQEVLRLAQFPHGMVAKFRQYVEAVSSTIIRRVRINRSQTPQDLLAATDRRQFIDDAVVASMPRGEGEGVDVHFFHLGRWVSNDELAQEYEQRGLVPDPYAQAQVNIKDPAFADQHPNGCQWKDADGSWCYLAFNRWDDERNVLVSRNDNDWYAHWWFAGVRKSPARNA